MKGHHDHVHISHLRRCKLPPLIIPIVSLTFGSAAAAGGTARASAMAFVWLLLHLHSGIVVFDLINEPLQTCRGACFQLLHIFHQCYSSMVGTEEVHKLHNLSIKQIP